MSLLASIDKSWFPVLNVLYQEPLNSFKANILSNISHQPRPEYIFRAFEQPLNKVKVVILGQDPYPTYGDAIGYAFATIKERKIPKSLQIIKAELINEGVDSHFSNREEWKTLNHWVDQGVFLLNTALTVETGKAGSHLKYWENFTQRVISHISTNNPCIWLLWGKKAQSFIPYINQNPYHVKGYDKNTIKQIPINPDWNYILKAPHPAAELYSGGKAGFYGCNHFIYTNSILERKHNSKINW